MPDPQAGEPCVGLRTLTLVGEPLRYNYFSSLGVAYLAVMDLLMSQMPPSYHLVVTSSLSLNVKYLFW